MTDTVAEEATPIQVPPPDSIYSHVVMALESDLSAMRARAEKAEREVKRHEGLAEEVEELRGSFRDLRDSVRELTQEVQTSIRTNNETFTYVKDLRQTIRNIFRT